MIIAVDIDSTIADWNDTYDRYLDNMGEPAAHLTRARDSETFNLWAGRTAEESDIISQVMDTPGFYRDIQPTDGAVDAVRKMVSDGHTVYIVTAPHPSNPTCADDKLWWVKTHLGSEFVDKLIITRDKTSVRADVLIDDRPDIHGQLKPVWIHVFYTQPWNVNFKDRPRIYNWFGNWMAVIEKAALRTPAYTVSDL